ncbi:Rhomboid-related protein 1 [Folsomia candida]|uniref:Rhomboid-related protein 1 n=1 Tax=Folsomia candida TaxID=158441 RepID=A0A226ETF1_FOLCA|nr:Rhomboid-related protein 1 [Folsomia candida]
MEQEDSRQGQGGNSPAPAAYSYSNLRQFVRQNSEKLGMIAEDVILPVNKRSIKRQLSTIHDPAVEVIDLEQRHTPSPTTPTPYGQTTLGLFYYYGDDTLLLLFGYDPYRRHELWRYVTIMLAHSSTSHVWGNVLFQLILGVLLEMVHNWKRTSIIYMASVVGGSLLITVMSPTVYGVGASAGVYGLLFAHLSTIILNWTEMDRKCCRLFWLLLYIGYDIAINSYVKFGLKIETNTSHAGHIGGAVTGFLVSILVLKNFEKKEWEMRMQKICAGLLLGFFVIIVLINVSFPSYYLPTEWNFNYESTYIHHILEAIKDSPEDSSVRKVCEADLECKTVLDQYIHNGTIPAI